MLHEWGLHAVSPTVELAASELLTNAVMHARTSFEVSVVAQDDLEVSVRDTGASSFPDPASTGTAVDGPGRDSEGGRGLLIVAAITDAWGITRHSNGTTAWFRLRLPRD
jgi:anti-sigma regulatory factor (Ser/Thr protein kinase)